MSFTETMIMKACMSKVYEYASRIIADPELTPEEFPKKTKKYNKSRAKAEQYWDSKTHMVML